MGETPTGDPKDGETPSTEGTTSTTSSEDEKFDEERAKATIAKQREAEREARKEAAAFKRELDEAKAELQKHQDNKLSETERDAKRRSELESKVASLETDLQEARSEREIEKAARKAGAVYPETTHRLVNRADVEFDSSGKVTNAEALVKKAKEAYPEYFGKGDADGGPRGNDPGAKTDMNALLRAAARGETR